MEEALSAVDVWILDLDSLDACADPLARCLTVEEDARRARIADPSHARRWGVGRAALRHLLARTLGVEPAGLVLLRGERGKPYLQGVHGLDFSISHSRNMALVGISAAAIGVDVEHDRAIQRLHRTARRILHDGTVDALLALPPQQQPAAFLGAWTVREAHVKAVGGGLFHTPDTLPFDPAQPEDGTPVVVHERDSDRAWTVARVRPAAGAHAAVAVSGVVSAIRVHDADQTRHLLERIT